MLCENCKNQISEEMNYCSNCGAPISIQMENEKIEKSSNYLSEPINPGFEKSYWNPGAAASWSLFFTPMFGSIIHMLNWKEIGNQEKAKQQKTWAIVSGILIAFYPILMATGIDSIDALIKIIILFYLFTWYFISGKPQISYFKEKIGQGYSRRSWIKPLFIAVGSWVIYIIATLFASAIGESFK